MWDACVEYLDWAHENPLLEAKVVSGKNGPEIVELAKARVFTITGLCVYLGVDTTTWMRWASNDPAERRLDLHPVISKVKLIIETQKYELAAASLANANLVARDLGLTERREVSGPGGGPVELVTNDMTPQEAERAYAKTLTGAG